MSTGAEQLNRLLRELGEALASSLGSGAHGFEDILVDLERAHETQAPTIIVTGVRAGLRTSLAAPPEASSLMRRVAALGGKYKHWLHVTVHFHGSQLPIPMGVTVRPLAEEHPHG